MYEIKVWTPELDLTEFYEKAAARGFENNSNQKIMVDCFRNEKEWRVWIIYYNGVAMGSVAAHSFDDVMGPNTYRVAVRSCAFTDHTPKTTLRTRNQIATNQHILSQIHIPVCMDWVGDRGKMYITSNENSSGSQRLVHRISMPSMVEIGTALRIKDVEYRGTTQTVWELLPQPFYALNEKYGQWPYKYIH